MRTLEMMKLAQENGRKYQTGDLLYSDSMGFHNFLGIGWTGGAFQYLNDLLELDDWYIPEKLHASSDEESEDDIVKALLTIKNVCEGNRCDRCVLGNVFGDCKILDTPEHWSIEENDVKRLVI